MTLAPLVEGQPSGSADAAPTSVSLFDQGLVQVVQASVAGLEPREAYVLALSHSATGVGALEPIAAFTTNPAGAAIVDTVGPIRQIVRPGVPDQRRYLVLVKGTPENLGPPLQVEVP